MPLKTQLGAISIWLEFAIDFKLGYFKETVTNITNLEKLLTNETIDILVSQDKTKLSEQLAIVEKLQEETGMVFENGAKDALNYLNSIELVSEAMTTSRENILSWTNSFKNERELANDLATSLGVNLATSLTSLDTLFNQLSTDADGLTDAELELLEANKALLESYEDNIESTYQTFLDLEEAIKNIESLRRQIQIRDLSEDIEQSEKVIQAYKDIATLQNENYTAQLDAMKNLRDTAKSLRDELIGFNFQSKLSSCSSIFLLFRKTLAD